MCVLRELLLLYFGRKFQSRCKCSSLGRMYVFFYFHSPIRLGKLGIKTQRTNATRVDNTTAANVYRTYNITTALTQVRLIEVHLIRTLYSGVQSINLNIRQHLILARFPSKFPTPKVFGERFQKYHFRVTIVTYSYL